MPPASKSRTAIPNGDPLPTRRQVDAVLTADAALSAWKTADKALHAEQSVAKLRKALLAVEAELRGVIEI